MEILSYFLLYLGCGGLCLYWFIQQDGYVWNPRYDRLVNVLTILTAVLLWPWIAAIELFLYWPERKGWIQQLTGLEEWIVLGGLLTAINLVCYVFLGAILSGVGAGAASLYTIVMIGFAMRRREHEFKRRCC